MSKSEYIKNYYSKYCKYKAKYMKLSQNGGNDIILYGKDYTSIWDFCNDVVEKCSTDSIIDCIFSLPFLHENKQTNKEAIRKYIDKYYEIHYNGAGGRDPPLRDYKSDPIYLFFYKNDENIGGDVDGYKFASGYEFILSSEKFLSSNKYELYSLKQISCDTVRDYIEKIGKNNDEYKFISIKIKSK